MEIEGCKNRIKQADDKIAELSDQLGKARQAIQMLEGENREKGRALGEMQRALEQEANRTRQRLADSNEEKNRAVRDLEGELNRAKQDRGRLQQELNNKVNELQSQR
jgi:chromosome segregation ATPase